MTITWKPWWVGEEGEEGRKRTRQMIVDNSVGS